MMPDRCDAVVIGAGAAGMMAAARAGQRGRATVLLDHAPEPGRKILISGGGRCNFTHLDASAERFLSGNRHFARSALAGYTPRDFLALVERYRIAWHEKTPGQLFCDNSARDIVAMLQAECDAAGVACHWPVSVSAVTVEHGRGTRFRVVTDRGAMACASVVLATGGLAIPKLGATDFALRTARQFGLGIVEAAPALVPLTDANADASLAGVSLSARASIGKIGFADGLVFTHRGLSGPAILQISSYWRQDDIVLDLLPGRDAFAALREARSARPRAQAASVLHGLVPARLAAKLAGELALPDVTAGNLPDRVLRVIAQRLSAFVYRPGGTEGYAKAEVMRGGIDTRDLDQKTLEARNVPGLFCVGEAVDVTGWLGGYNFQWAWASGHAAGMAA
jgi:predicted Rossmann fold flavoprotein